MPLMLETYHRITRNGTASAQRASHNGHHPWASIG
jgi:hypothetical protein